MTPEDLQDYMDRHHIDVVRTHATNLDGAAIGKYLSRDKFLGTLPRGHAIADMALGMDLAGNPHLTFWHEFRRNCLGDIYMQPDLDTLISVQDDPAVGHCFTDFVDEAGAPIPICPRGALKRMIAALADRGFEAKTTFEIEFYLFRESFNEAREARYQDLRPIGGSDEKTIYFIRNARYAAPFMDKVIKRLTWEGMPWESWSDEGAPGQLELNIPPTDPLTAADRTVRIKQILFEVAQDMGHSVTFMANPGTPAGTGMHAHLSLTRDGEPVFHDPAAEHGRSEVMQHWLGGMMATLPGAMSFLAPTINSYRRVVDFVSSPTTVTWGEDNKSTAIRSITGAPGATRVEHRAGAGDMNPYLALATILAGGIAGLDHALLPPQEHTRLGWGASAAIPRLPNTISRAFEALSADRYLPEVLGEDLVKYWIDSRRHEWFSFGTECTEPDSRRTTDWEFSRYFEAI